MERLIEEYGQGATEIRGSASQEWLEEMYFEFLIQIHQFLGFVVPISKDIIIGIEKLLVA
jgi:hypothetical protein